MKFDCSEPCLQKGIRKSSQVNGYLTVRVLYGTLRITIGNSKHSALHIQIKNKWTHSTSLSSTPVILTPPSYPTLMHKAI